MPPLRSPVNDYSVSTDLLIMINSSTKERLLLGSVFVLYIAGILTLYYLRSVDNNSLCRWPWVFSHVKAQQLFVLLLGAISASLFLSKYNFNKLSAISLLLISFAVGTFFWGEPEVLMDASRYFTAAKYLQVYGIHAFLSQWGREISAWTDLPLMPFLYGLAFKLFGEFRLVIQIITTFLFAGSVVLTYQLGKLLWDRETGIVAALLLFCFPHLYLHIPLLMVDLPTMFFLLLSVYTLVYSLRRVDYLSLVYAALALAAALLVKYSAWLFLSVHGVILFVAFLENRWIAIKRYLLIVLFSCLLLSPLLYILSDIIIDQLRFLIEYQRPGLNRWSESFVSTFFFQTHPLIIISASIGLVIAVLQKNVKVLIPAFPVLLILLLQVNRIRYILPIFPFIVLVSAFALQRLSSIKVKKFLVIAAVFTSFILTVFAFMPFTKTLSTINIKDAANFVNTLDDDDIQVYILNKPNSEFKLDINVALLDFFMDKKLDVVTDKYEEKGKEQKTSSLRFTWNYTIPPFYQRKELADISSAPLVIIASTESRGYPGRLLPALADYNKEKSFTTSTGLFSYKTIIRVFYNE